MKKILLTFLGFFLLLGGGVFGYGKYLEHKSPDVAAENSVLENANTTNNTETKDCDEMQKSFLGNITVLASCDTQGLSDYKRGVEYGALLQEEIQEVITALDEKVLSKNESKRFMIKTYLLSKAYQLESFIPEKYQQEMKGIADGAQVKYSDILLINTYDDLLYLAGCSSIAGGIDEKNTEFFHARNLDYPIADLAGKTVLWNQGEVILIGFPGYVGALTATNKKTGLSLSSHTSRSGANALGIPTGFLYRSIVENAENISASKEILENAQRTIGNNLLISSFKENTARVFEFDAENITENSGENFSFATNHFVSKDFVALQNNSTPNSIKRYNDLHNFVESDLKIAPENITNLLSHFDGSQKGWSSLANSGTVQSIIIFPGKKKIFLANGTNAPVTAGGYREYSY
jgi:predicted choloylglycine hydrolase